MGANRCRVAKRSAWPEAWGDGAYGQSVEILYQYMPMKNNLASFTALAIQPGIGVGNGCVRVVAATIALEAALAVAVRVGWAA